MVKREIILYTIAMLLISGLLLAVGSIRNGDNKLIRLEEGWEYRWYEAEPWSAIQSPINPPDRNGRQRVSFRIELPEVDLPDATLFIYSIDINASLSAAGEKLYTFGDIDNGEFIGWPWHLIDLPAFAFGGHLEFDIFSDYRDIGLFGEVFLGDRSDQIRRLYQRDLIRVVVCSISLTIAIIFIGIFFALKSFRAFLYFALISFVLVFRVYSFTLTKQLYIDAPLFWEYFRLISFLGVYVAVALSIGEIIGGRIAKYCRWIVYSFCLIFLISIGGPLVGLFSISDNYVWIDVPAILSLLILAAFTVVTGFRGNREAELLSINFLIIAILALYSTLMYNSVVPWNDEIDYLMLFQLATGMVYVLIRRFAVAHVELRETNATLENRVAVRTAELAEANRQLETEKRQLHHLSITDGLTQLRSREYALDRLRSMMRESARYGKPLSLILFDLDHFKRVNDEFGHQSGDQVLVEAAAAIQSALRESDVCGRYGGEEFLVVMPETSINEASAVAERVRIQIAKLVFPEPIPPITISGGVAEYDGGTPEAFLKRADVCLYQAKSGGRNSIIR